MAEQIGRGDLVRALQAGQEAGRAGDRVTACPYPSGDLRRSAWVRGYASTRPLPDGATD
ncbi:Rmf/CrpP fold protein [Streptomyces sp. NPDC051994]|uniref:Rmf/CrpP fold protein n=1 Tax=unclassified Streptomyces TaxID=2593676 RepID=UPI0034288A45